MNKIFLVALFVTSIVGVYAVGIQHTDARPHHFHCEGIGNCNIIQGSGGGNSGNEDGGSDSGG